MTFTYPAIFTKTDKGYTGYFPDLEGIEVFGETMELAIREARDEAFNWITVELEEDDPEMPTITDISDMKLEPNQEAREIEVHYRFFEGWDE
ncbi:MAG: type II toxin-antitoxin system HicB family antitoxin [Lachnospiraceae bacterium]|nr:type II toxin-antitoxin system HicB family antitoxin [Lachnospiraceae bacterium]